MKELGPVGGMSGARPLDLPMYKPIVNNRVVPCKVIRGTLSVSVNTDIGGKYFFFEYL